MGFIGWIIVLTLAYIALARALVFAIDSIRRRDWAWLFVFVLIALFAGTLFLAIPARFENLSGALEWAIGSYAVFVMLLAITLGWLRALLRDDQNWRDRKARSEISRQVKLHLSLATGAIIFSIPFYWLISTSLKPDERTSVYPPDLIPVKQRRVHIYGIERMVYETKFDDKTIRVAKMNELDGGNWEVRFLDGTGVIRIIPKANLKPSVYPIAVWKNYSDALGFLPPEYHHGLVPLWNTVFVTIMVIIGTVFSSSLVAFAFARLKWPGRDLLFVIMLATMMIPGAVTMLPVFLIYRWLGWIDTLRPLWVGAFFGGGFNIFLLRQFFMTIPTDLEDAAKIDGCSYFTIYWKIMLPLITPALAALTIFAFMASWNNFMGPLIYISSPEKMTLAYALQLFQGSHGGEPAMMMAAATLVMLPVLFVFFFTQRYMIQGVTLTGIK